VNNQVQALPGVVVDGVNTGEALYLAELRVVQRLDAPARCELGWRATTLDIQTLDELSPSPGQQLRVRIEGQATALFSGLVTSVEHVYEPAGGFMLLVRGYDDLIRLQSQQTIRTHVEVTTAELLDNLASAAGLTVTSEDDGPVWPRVVPRFEHDLALLRHYAARSGLHFIVHDEKLRLFAPDATSSETLELTLGEDLLEAQFERNHVRPVGKVDVFGWDVHTGEPHRAQSQNPDDSLTAVRTLLGAAVESESEAEALAAAELFRARSNCAVLTGIAEGSVRLRPGCRVLARGVAAGTEGPYMVTRVVHTVDTSSGYVCEFDTRPEQPDRQHTVPSLVLGEVSDIDDPDGRGRVQVALPGYDQALSTWMMVLQLGAGADKGLVALPEVGDLVLVGLPDGDPSRGIVLGGVYRSDGPPHDPEAARDASKNRPYSLATRAGQRIELNDADGSIKLRNATGSFIALTPDGLTLHAVGELVVEAPGQRLNLAADRIDLERRQ